MNKHVYDPRCLCVDCIANEIILTTRIKEDTKTSLIQSNSVGRNDNLWRNHNGRK